MVAHAVNSSTNISNSNSSGKKDGTLEVVTQQQLPLVGETILKKRHDLDDLARKRAALEEIEPKRRSSTRSTGKARDGTAFSKKKKFYVFKSETVFVNRRNRQIQHRRVLRVQKKGMQTRASNKPIVITKHVVIDDEDNKDIK